MPVPRHLIKLYPVAGAANNKLASENSSVLVGLGFPYFLIANFPPSKILVGFLNIYTGKFWYQKKVSVSVLFRFLVLPLTGLRRQRQSLSIIPIILVWWGVKFSTKKLSAFSLQIFQKFCTNNCGYLYERKYFRKNLRKKYHKKCSIFSTANIIVFFCGN